MRDKKITLKNRPSIPLVLTILVFYAYLSLSLYLFAEAEFYYSYIYYDDPTYLLVIFIPVAWVLVCFLLSARLLSVDSKRLDGTPLIFRRKDAFGAFGTERGSFQHVFKHPEAIGTLIEKRINASFAGNGMSTKFEPITVSDQDTNLTGHENRRFTLGRFDRTIRQTEPLLLLQITTTGKMQSLQWWLFEKGLLSANRKLTFIALSPVTIFTWFLPWMRNLSNIFKKYYSAYSSTYDQLDLVTRMRWIHQTVFDALVDELDSHGIDTSDLKEQRANVMNIDVSGGKVSMGNVVQGAMNKITTRNKGAK